jgi:serine/threonine protein kinase
LGSYVPRTLKYDLKERGRLPPRECLRIGLALTTALGHRDVKPSNIIFLDGVPKLADIGLVTETDRTLSFVGTEGYIAPETP